ncbi:MAG: hypothetical protein GX434_09575 [Peptococcaceae bacterium]|nr:hypothetical protein [Peptococcaceae bacterium]
MVKRINPFSVITIGLVLVTLLAVFVALSGSVSSSGYKNFPEIYNTSGDLDRDGIPEEYTLANYSLAISEGKNELWRTPPEWQVDRIILGDVDNDGSLNLVMTLWKTGSFGSIRPFWKNGEDQSYKNHLFVYKLHNDQFKPVWCSSDLDSPILDLSIEDTDGDSLQELRIREGRYQKEKDGRYRTDSNSPGRFSVWKWEEWGFRLQANPSQISFPN